MTPTPRLIEELDSLYDSYVSAVNAAVESDDLALAEELAHRYDREAVELMAEREGRQDLLPLFGSAQPRDTRLRRLARRLGAGHAS